MIVCETAGGTAYTPCPAGTYPARCVRLVDLGTQQTDYQGEIKTARKLLLAFEIVDAELRRDDGEPFVLSKRYTVSLHEKAALRKDLAGWRGRDFTPEELRGFDLRSVLGQPVLVNVIETIKGDRTFANIAGLMRAPRGMPIPEAIEAPIHWDMSAPEPNWGSYAVLHPKLIEQIEQSPEFKRLTPPRRIETPARTQQNAPQRAAAPRPMPAPAQAPQNAPEPFYAVESGFESMPDDCPF